MKFVIATVEEANALGIKVIPTMRQSLDGTKVVLHDEYINHIDVLNSLPRYEHDSTEFIDIMNSPEWSEAEEQADSGNEPK